jgi:methanogenic corrinoid protein MtbC1
MQVVVHCAQSLQRGPASAALLKQRLQELGIEKQVVVLDGGFNKFSELYQADASVVEAGAAPKLAAAGAAAQAEQH